MASQVYVYGGGSVMTSSRLLEARISEMENQDEQRRVRKARSRLRGGSLENPLAADFCATEWKDKGSLLVDACLWRPYARSNCRW